METVLREIPIFDNLERKQVDELSDWLQRREYGAGENVIREGERPDGLYVLAKGTAEVVKETAGGSLVIATVEAPSVFGEMGLLNEEEARSAGVRAQTKLVTGFLPAPLFASKLAENNLTALRIGVNLGRIACQRLRSTTRKLTALSEDVTRHALHAETFGINERSKK